jgi:hypothetical protein
VPGHVERSTANHHAMHLLIVFCVCQNFIHLLSTLDPSIQRKLEFGEIVLECINPAISAPQLQPGLRKPLLHLSNVAVLLELTCRAGSIVQVFRIPLHCSILEGTGSKR